jgi:hypothetical protein
MKKFLTISSLLTFLIVAVVTFIATSDANVSALTAGIFTSAFAGIGMPKGSFSDFAGLNGDAGQVIVMTNDRKRANFMVQKKELKASADNFSQSYLRLEAVLSTASNEIRFELAKNDGNSYPTENRLDKNDVFVADEIGLFILKQDVANKKTNGLLSTYPSIVDYTAAQQQDILAIYQGFLKFTLGDVVKVRSMEVLQFLQVPETQKTSATNFDQKTANSGFCNITPGIRLDGTGTNEIVLKFPSYNAWAGNSAVAGTEHRIVLMLKGFLATNASKVKI